MPKAYVIFTEDIKDQAGMRAYEKASTAAIVAGFEMPSRQTETADGS